MKMNVSTIKQKALALVDKFKTSDHLFMIIVPIIIGLLGGLGAAALKFLIHFFQYILWTNEHYIAPWYLKLIIPAGGAFVVGLIIYFFSQEAKGHGVPEVMEAIAIRNGVIRPRVVVGKVLASALTIGSGGSVGREGPIIQTGSAIGSVLGQIFKLSRRRMQTLVGCGAAAGIAAAFNAPIAGAMFAVEIILGDFTVSQFSPIVISSVTATVVSRAFYGNYPAFQVPKYELIHWIELIPYAVLGLIAGIVAVLFIRVLYFIEGKFDAIKVPDFYKTTVGGLMVGSLGIFFPQIFGVGYDAINQALYGQMDVWLLGALIFLKILASSLTLGSGSSGGIFAPSLFMGAMTGGFFGSILHKLFPAITAGPGAYALVAMSAVVAATTHAPITAILIIFEMTGDYKIILPLMIATIISLVTTRFQEGSIYTLKLMRRGINIHEGKELNVLRSMKVKDVMRRSIEILSPDTPMTEVIEKFITSEHNEFYIKDEKGQISERISQIELGAIAPQYETLKDFVLAKDITIPNMAVVNENDNLGYVMRQFGKENISEIPVVSSSDSTNVLGTVWRLDVITAYNKEILKRDLAGEVLTTLTNVSRKKMVEVMEGYYMHEIDVPANFIGKKIKELDVRNKYGVDIILIKKKSRNGQLVTEFPHARYTFHPHDSLLLLGEREKVEYMSKL
ncbi:MAG: CBS domain-containing protein [Candidatus Aminicenantes bacterium]|nr:CBS domain-containing protein [Candidatus Aminicenantes bacterium]NIM77778.1 CBS domain-containing protein [Candidatus Aminicenantes bacterium]NIO79695.1 CBS domain-containing protein [Candidatus Aminicenantes bacterium]